MPKKTACELVDIAQEDQAPDVTQFDGEHCTLDQSKLTVAVLDNDPACTLNTRF